MASASTQVILLPELLESILCSLPLNDLLLNAQLVSRSWRHAVQGSPSLSQKLFKHPGRRSNRQRKVIFNPLLQHAFPHFFPLSSESVHTETDFLRRQRTAKSPSEFSPANRRVALESYLRKEASWRSMMIVQPPVTQLEIVYTSHEEICDCFCRGTFECEDGLRMGMFYDLVQTHAGLPVSLIDLNWQLEEPDDDLKLVVNFHSIVKNGKTERDIAHSELRSKGYKPVTIKFGEMTCLCDGEKL